MNSFDTLLSAIPRVYSELEEQFSDGPSQCHETVCLDDKENDVVETDLISKFAANPESSFMIPKTRLDTSYLQDTSSRLFPLKQQNAELSVYYPAEAYSKATLEYLKKYDLNDQEESKLFGIEKNGGREQKSILLDSNRIRALPRLQ